MREVEGVGVVGKSGIGGGLASGVDWSGRRLRRSTRGHMAGDTLLGAGYGKGFFRHVAVGRRGGARRLVLLIRRRRWIRPGPSMMPPDGGGIRVPGSKPGGGIRVKQPMFG